MLYYVDDYAATIKFFHSLLKTNGRILIVHEAGQCPAYETNQSMQTSLFENEFLSPFSTCKIWFERNKILGLIILLWMASKILLET